MFGKNIKFRNFLSNNRFNKNKSILYKIYKNVIDEKNEILLSLSRNYKDSYSKKILKKINKINDIFLIGMGGSILGAEAIYNFLQPKIKKKFYFFNNLDEDKISRLKREENLSKILFIIISKSGNTIETLANAFALNIIKKKSKNIILISEKKNNLLFSLSKKLNLFYIEHKSFIGGRFSVLSEVGLVPAYLMGLNLIELRSKTLEFLKRKHKLFLKNSIIKIVNLINSKKFNSYIFLNYAPELEKFLLWLQQLIAESLGKKNKGLLPVISNAPKDHHSLLQLYLDGPKDKIFYIFSTKGNLKEKININNNFGVKSFLNKKKIGAIKNAQKKALIKSLIQKNIPFRQLEINKTDEKNLGNLFSYFIIETIIIGKLLNINPFDQPAVEQVKVYTKELLT